VRIYTGDVAKRLKTYRLEPSECADFAAAVAETGETESDVLRAAIRAYIQRVRTGETAFAPPVAESPVYTPDEAPASYLAAPEEPQAPPCRHPADRVDVDTNVCQDCGEDVW